MYAHRASGRTDVSIHAPARGAAAHRRMGGWRHGRFDPRPREGGGAPHRKPLRQYQEFRSTPPRGGRRRRARRGARRARFDPRPREGGGVIASCQSLAVHAFRSTPPRGGRRHAGPRRPPQIVVSIHAPARGAADTLARSTLGLDEFRSTPPRGGRRAARPSYRRRRSFDPRPREGGGQAPRDFSGGFFMFRSTPPRGGRPDAAPGGAGDGHVSIHAPARGAACTFAVGRRPLIVFRSTPPRGGRRGR